MTLTSTPLELQGNYPSGVPRYKTCPILKVKNKFSSHMTVQIYKVKYHAFCMYSKLSYLITHRRCGLQYVSETSQSLHARVNGYPSDIMHRRIEVSPVAEHFNSGTHLVLGMMVMVIELSSSCDPCLQM